MMKKKAIATEDDLLGAPPPEAAFEAAPEPSEEDLAKVIKLARGFYAKQLEVEEAQAVLDAKTNELTAIRDVELPAAMIHLGVKDLGLANGWRVELKKIVAGNISQENQPKAFSWLEKNGYADLIKRVVKVSFGKDEAAWAKKFLADMARRKRPLRAEIKEAIAHQTLQKFIRDRVTEIEIGTAQPGKAFPEELFGVFKKTVAILEAPTTKA